MSHSWVQIDLESLAWNHRLITQKLGSQTQLLAVVKANAYGHGVTAVSRTLHDLGVRWFGVASVAEGQALREDLPDANILVLGYIPREEISVLLDHNLIPTLHSAGFATELDARAERKGIRKATHLKIDTGMGRLGLHARELDDLLDKIAAMPHLNVEGIFSHFSSADEEDLTPSHSQLRAFDAAVARAKAAGLPIRWIHLANSHAIFRLPQAHFNMARGGLFLYGLYPSKIFPHDYSLKPVLSWKIRVGLIKEFHPGQTVSYGRTHSVTHKTRIAVLPVGYADGYNRSLSNRGKVLIRGHFAPVVGRVTMDHFMVDVGHIPDAREGDEAVLIGRQDQNTIGAEEMADWLETISYEVVCAIGPRIQRKTTGAVVTAFDKSGSTAII